MASQQSESQSHRSGSNRNLNGSSKERLGSEPSLPSRVDHSQKLNSTHISKSSLNSLNHTTSKSSSSLLSKSGSINALNYTSNMASSKISSNGSTITNPPRLSPTLSSRNYPNHGLESSVQVSRSTTNGSDVFRKPSLSRSINSNEPRNPILRSASTGSISSSRRSRPSPNSSPGSNSPHSPSSPQSTHKVRKPPPPRRKSPPLPSDGIYGNNNNVMNNGPNLNSHINHNNHHNHIHNNNFRRNLSSDSIPSSINTNIKRELKSGPVSAGSTTPLHGNSLDFALIPTTTASVVASQQSTSTLKEDGSKSGGGIKGVLNNFVNSVQGIYYYNFNFIFIFIFSSSHPTSLWFVNTYVLFMYLIFSIISSIGIGMFSSESKMEISSPYNPVHLTHVGYNQETGEFTVMNFIFLSERKFFFFKFILSILLLLIFLSLFQSLFRDCLKSGLYFSMRPVLQNKINKLIPKLFLILLDFIQIHKEGQGWEMMYGKNLIILTQHNKKMHPLLHPIINNVLLLLWEKNLKKERQDKVLKQVQNNQIDTIQIIIV